MNPIILRSLFIKKVLKLDKYPYLVWSERDRLWIYGNGFTPEQFQKESDHRRMLMCNYHVTETGIVRKARYPELHGMTLEQACEALTPACEMNRETDTSGWAPLAKMIYERNYKRETETKNQCECGTGSPLGQNHSQWCKCFRSEF